MAASIGDTLQAPDGSEWTLESSATLTAKAHGFTEAVTIDSSGYGLIDLGAPYRVSARPDDPGVYVMLGGQSSPEPSAKPRERKKIMVEIWQGEDQRLELGKEILTITVRNKVADWKLAGAHVHYLGPSEGGLKFMVEE